MDSCVPKPSSYSIDPRDDERYHLQIKSIVDKKITTQILLISFVHHAGLLQSEFHNYPQRLNLFPVA